jgi:hypothetical protein
MNFQNLKEKFIKNGQGHIFRFENELNENEIEEFYQDLKVYFCFSSFIFDLIFFKKKTIDIDNLKEEFDNINKHC